MTAAPLWNCRKCGGPKRAQSEGGRPKVRAFRTGYAAVLLECGHWAAVAKDRAQEPPVLAVLEAVFPQTQYALRLKGGEAVK